METWPSSLTGFTDDFSIQPNTVAEKNMTDGGVNHAFSRWTSDIVEISGTLHFGQDDLATFKTFYRDTIKNGTESFYLTDFPIFGDYETHEVVFKEHPDISYAAWMEWDVSVTLLSSDLGYMTEAAMTALLPEEPDADYVTFPTSVFGEVTDDFGWQQDDLIARGNTDGGDFPFAKRISHVSSTTAQFGIEVSRVNMNLFYAWGLYKLAGFKKWFKVELPYGGTTQTVTARFSEPPKASFNGRGNADEGSWTISGSLEIYEVNYWALEDCDSLPVRTEIVITSQPIDAYAGVGESASFTVVATGMSSYQWYFSDGSTATAVDGATSATLSFTSVAVSNYGSYFCRLTDESGYFVNSSSATLAEYDENTLLLVQVDSEGNIVERTGNGTVTTSGTVIVDATTTHDGYGSIRNTESGQTTATGYTRIDSTFTLDSDYTVEGWVYSLISSDDSLLTLANDGNSEVRSVLTATLSGALWWWPDQAFGVLGSTITGQWVHLAIVRSGDTVKLFVDGELTGEDSGSVYGDQLDITYLVIGWSGPCCWENIRISNAALYTANFIPPERF